MANEQEKKRPERVIEALMRKRGDDPKSDLDDVHVDRLLHVLRAQGGEHGAHLADVLGGSTEGFQPTEPAPAPDDSANAGDTRIDGK